MVPKYFLLTILDKNKNNLRLMTLESQIFESETNCAY